MNRLFILLLSAMFMVSTAGAASSWHDDMISYMNSAKDVESNVVVSRDPSTGAVRQANYRYTFKKKALYQTVRSQLIDRESSASNLIMRPGKEGEIIMRFVDGGDYRNYSLSKVNGRYQLIISVNDNSRADINSAELQRQAQERTRQAQERNLQAQERARQAQERARQAQERARQAQERARQAQERARQAQERARQAQQRRVTRAVDSHGCVYYITDNDADNSATIQEHRRKLKEAEEQRRRALNSPD